MFSETVFLSWTASRKQSNRRCVVSVLMLFIFLV